MRLELVLFLAFQYHDRLPGHASDPVALRRAIQTVWKARALKPRQFLAGIPSVDKNAAIAEETYNLLFLFRERQADKTGRSPYLSFFLCSSRVPDDDHAILVSGDQFFSVGRVAQG